MTQAYPLQWPGGSPFVEMPSGLLLPESVAESVARRWARPKAIDLFAGCGGMSLGTINAGFEVVAAVENDPLCAITYMCNLGTYPAQFHFVSDADRSGLEKQLAASYRRAGLKVKGGKFVQGKDRKIVEAADLLRTGSGWISKQPPGTPGVSQFFLGDVRQITGTDILGPLGLKVGEIDLVMGGPPCQGFSYGGKRNVMDPRNSLLFEFARLVLEIQPKTIMMENVPGIIDMVTPDGVPVVDAFCRVLEDGGWAGYRGLLKSIEAQTGAVGLLRSKTKKKADKSRTSEATANLKADDAQSDMFAEAPPR